jgi:predicted Zn finger-like uncharacterized protein
MYTQCPECQIAFRVTARVLQQASGNVRCGNCSHAFNALHYLSEDMPESPAAEDDSTEDLSHDELAETSRRLLEALDELAGPEDVRIEDTGVEWRVLDEAAMDVAEASQAVPDEPRYDDNTPLPEDFDEQPAFGRPVEPAATPQSKEADDPAPAGEDADALHGDIALSDPEDWTDILEEVSDPAAEPIEVEQELAAIHSELSAIDDALTDEVPRLADEEIFAEPAAQAGGTAESIDFEVGDGRESEGAAEEVDFEFGGEGDDGVAVEEIDFELGDDEDTGVFDAAAAGDDTIREPGRRESARDVESVEDEVGLAGDEDERQDEPDRADEPDDEQPALGEESAGQASWMESLVQDAGADDSPDPHAESEAANDVAGDDGVAASNPDLAAEPEAASADPDLAAEPGESAEPDTGHEEPETETALDYTARMMGLENPEDLFDESSGEVETIIMEGEFVRSEIEKERMAAENAARSQLDDPERLADTYAMNRGKVRGGRRSYDPPSSRMMAALAFLSLLLVGQIVHNYRESLATVGFFNHTIGPVYRLLGSPVTPEWDIGGWQFEATNGSVNENETALTIVSRIANRSGESLPYPLIHLSLTNRFEDVMGSRVLEPGEFLPDDVDPSQLVSPGQDFTAVLEVEDPSPEATGFKLDICYRVEPGTVRCAIQDFKD